MVVRIDPDSLPTDPGFDRERGGPLPAVCLKPEVLQHILQNLPQLTLHTGDLEFAPPQVVRRQAAVLIGLRPGDDGLHMLLTVRADNLRDHAGQISFPGGQVDAGDADVIATALRESHEELGLPPEGIRVLGCLPVYTTISGFDVTPVVALLPKQVQLQADPREVSEYFEVPLAFLMNGQNHQRRLIRHGNTTRGVYALEYTAQRRYLIWGATAAMLRNFYLVVQAGHKITMTTYPSCEPL